MHKSPNERLQELIHSLESGAISQFLKRAIVLLGFAALALFFNFTKFEGFNNTEAMESAHLARQLASGHGYTTDSIRPFSVHLLQAANPTNAASVLKGPVPELSNPPGYPFLLALTMKVLPYDFKADRDQPWLFQPEIWIRAINEIMFFLAVLVLFRLARRLFDEPVAWLAAAVFAGTELYWRFCSSGLPTIWLILLVLLLVSCLVALDERERRPAPAPSLRGSVALAATAGGLAGLGFLTLYSFGWIILPVLLYLNAFIKRARGRLILVAALSFLVVAGPWIVRNVVVSHTPFGTAGFALVENTPHLGDDLLERSLNPLALHNVSPGDVMNKFLLNEGAILKNDLPRLGGNWACAFFLCGLLLPYRNPGLRRFRLFLLWSLVIMTVAQAFCQTHLSTDTPEINTENLLVLLSPLVLIIGVGAFLNLLDHVDLPDLAARRGAWAAFVAVMCAPLLLTLFGPPKAKPITPYSPYHVQSVAAMMLTNELMMSDIPWGVAWYGNRPCSWLTLNDDDTFKDLEKIKPVQGIFLTQRTSDRRFLSQMIVNQEDNQSDWSFFYLDSLPGWGHSNVPSGFPLQKAILDFPPDQMFISDRNRWLRADKR